MIPVFVGGTGRSGTYLLYLILRCHPKIMALPQAEHRFLTDPDGLFDLIDAISDRWMPFHTDRAVRGFLQMVRRIENVCPWENRVDRFFKRFGISLTPSPYRTVVLGNHLGHGASSHFQHTVEDFIRKIGLIEYEGSWCGSPGLIRPIMRVVPKRSRGEAVRLGREFLGRLYGDSPAAEGKSHWIDTTPHLLLRTAEVFEILPEARFIHMRRNPLDTAASMMRQGWGPKTAEGCGYWLKGCYDVWAGLHRRLPEDRILEVRLCDLNEDPPFWIGRIAELIGLDVLPTMLEVERRSHIGRYKAELTAEEISVLEGILGSHLDDWR